MPLERPNVLDKVRRIVSRCDICVVDLDECIYPRFTQTVLGALLLARSFLPRNVTLMPRLMAGAAYITVTRLLQIFGRTPANIGLMSSFSRIMKGVPMTLMEECAAKLPSMGPREWRGALGAVASAMPVYLLTFSIEPIARAYAGVRDGCGRAIFSGYRGTPIEVRDGLFRKCLFGRDSFTPWAKAGELSRILGETGRERPLIIGHGEDEAAMCVMADEMGGGSIAICRPGRGSLPGASIRVSSWCAISRALNGKDSSDDG